MYTPKKYALATQSANGLMTKEDKTKIDNSILTANKTVYVDATNGNDNTGDGTQAKPWKTIQKAVDMCPPVNNKYVYTILLANGIYSSNTYIYQKHIYIGSASTDSNITIRGLLYVGRKGYLTVDCPLTIDTATNGNSIGIQSATYSKILLSKDITIIGNDIKTNAYGLVADNGGKILIKGKAEVSKCNVAFECNSGSSLTLSNAIATDCTYGLDSQSNANIGFTNYTYSNVTYPYHNGKGGKINRGSQGWELIGSVTGKKTVTIDRDLYTEFYIKQNYNDRAYQYVIPIKESGNGVRLNAGDYMRSDYYASASIYIEGNNIRNDFFIYNGTDKIENTTMNVYGRRV